ncbi:hypothetical protein B0H15DRAFT_31916 [Mycena belliarum]|uniref:Uncharacterized protein n=1 Tax=Mycena belliarum TaxID=1033014 RepID=A0AAD6XW41_9AGAR|nr:hypothetical protein B0H15DRAFT_31916 [Mycena belliae]
MVGERPRRSRASIARTEGTSVWLQAGGFAYRGVVSRGTRFVGGAGFGRRRQGGLVWDSRRHGDHPSRATAAAGCDPRIPALAEKMRGAVGDSRWTLHARVASCTSRASASANRPARLVAAGHSRMRCVRRRGAFSDIDMTRTQLAPRWFQPESPKSPSWI